MLFSLPFKRSYGAPPPTLEQPVVRRRRIGLALGAGSARGWSHIGVIQELADHGIVPDVVAGTSIGAVVGGAYAAGKLATLESFARSLNRRRMFVLMDFSLSGTGLIAGGRLKRRLNGDLAGLSIEALPMPFAAVAAEMTTGREVMLTRGNLVDAVRASYALPGIFEPVMVGGRRLFDGALVNPVPVSVCRALGADVVIAVNLSPNFGLGLGPGRGCGQPASNVPPTDAHSALDTVAAAIAEGPIEEAPKARQRLRQLLAKRRLFMKREDGAPGIATVLMDAFAIAQDQISRSRLAADPPDVMINARLTTCGLFDFHRAADLIAHGRTVTRRAMPEIEAMMAAGDERPAN